MQAIEPLPVADILTEEEFARRFMGRHVITMQAKGAIKTMEEMRRQVFCKKCEEHDELRLLIKVTELCVRYEEDLLRAVPCLALCTCFNCGFEMYVDMKRKPDLRSEAQRLQDEAASIRERELRQLFEMEKSKRLAGMQSYGDLSNAIGQTRAAIDFARQSGIDGANISHLFNRLRELESQATVKQAPPLPGGKYRFGEY